VFDCDTTPTRWGYHDREERAAPEEREGRLMAREHGTANTVYSWRPKVLMPLQDVMPMHVMTEKRGAAPEEREGRPDG